MTLGIVVLSADNVGLFWFLYMDGWRWMAHATRKSVVFLQPEQQVWMVSVKNAWRNESCYTPINSVHKATANTRIYETCHLWICKVKSHTPRCVPKATTGTRMNVTCHIYMDESCHTQISRVPTARIPVLKNLSPQWKSHVTLMSVVFLKSLQVHVWMEQVTYTRMSHVTHRSVVFLQPAYEWNMSHIHGWVMSHTHQSRSYSPCTSVEKAPAPTN